MISMTICKHKTRFWTPVRTERNSSHSTTRLRAPASRCTFRSFLLPRSQWSLWPDAFRRISKSKVVSVPLNTAIVRRSSRYRFECSWISENKWANVCCFPFDGCRIREPAEEGARKTSPRDYSVLDIQRRNLLVRRPKSCSAFSSKGSFRRLIGPKSSQVTDWPRAVRGMTFFSVSLRTASWTRIRKGSKRVVLDEAS